MTAQDPLRLQIQALDIGYGRQRIAGPLNGAWEPGRVEVLTGPNGCGKTTLLRTILGFLPSLAGSIEGLDGRRISYVPQLQSFDSGFPVTVAEVVGTGASGRHSRRERNARIDEALETVGMSAMRRQRFFRLSGGQQQRVLLARALFADAELVALDEPTAGVDPAASTAVWQELRRIAELGRIVLVVTHDLFHAREYGDRVLALQHGTLEEFTG